MISDLVIKSLSTYCDDRGSLTELFRIDELPSINQPVMGYESWTKPGVVRGCHEHLQQWDAFVFIGPGNFSLHLWDNRIESKTYQKYVVMEVGEVNPVLVLIPPKVVHGYKNTSSYDGRVLNFPNQLYGGWQKQAEIDEIRHENDINTKFRIN